MGLKPAGYSNRQPSAFCRDLILVSTHFLLAWLPQRLLSGLFPSLSLGPLGGGDQHVLTKAQRSIKEILCLKNSLPPWAHGDSNALCTEGTVQSWAEGDLGLIFQVFAHGEPWFSD